MVNFLKEVFLSLLILLWIFYAPIPWWAIVIGVYALIIWGPKVLKMKLPPVDDSKIVKITLHHEGSVAFWKTYFKLFHRNKID